MNAYRFLKLDRLPQYIEDRLEFYKNPANVSGLGVWLKLTSGAGPADDQDGGLTIVSNPLIPTFGENSIHGSLTTEAPAGSRNFSGDPVGDFVGTGETGIGFAPRPVVEQVQITNGTRGLSRKAEFDIVCHTREQVEVISQYFLEPGFTVTIEWGWNVSDSYAQVATTAAELADLQDFDILDAKRAQSNGTYDAYIGVVTGGGIDQSDNKYTVSVTLSGIGQVFSYIQNHQNSDFGFEDELPEDGEQLAGTTDVGNSDIQIDAQVEQNQQESFAYMFNSLPEKWKTARVSELIENERISDHRNFINFIPNVIEDIAAETSAAGWKSWIVRFLPRSEVGTVDTGDGERTPIPSGEGIVDEERYIRFGALMDILYTGGRDLDIGIQLAGSNNNIPLRINTRNVPIQGFRKMFSTDGSKLYIPNELLPDFGLNESFSTINEHIYFKAVYDVIDKRFNPSFRTDYFNEFPRSQKLEFLINNPNVDTGDLSSDDFSADPYEYGFLEDLFINFDFALSVIQRKGLSIREVILELLNGMSSAVDNYWDFDIIESDKGGLTVVDYGFTGFKEKPPVSLISNGTESSFTSFNLSIDIPGAMMNQIIGRRLSADGAEFQTDLVEMPDRLFGDGVEFIDKIAKNIQKFNTSNQTSTRASRSQEELIRQNFERFQKNATIITNITSYDTRFYTKHNLTGIDIERTRTKGQNPLDYVFVGAWNDSKLFKINRHISKGTTVERGLSPLLPISTNFTTFGIGGIRNGLTYRIGDLPDKYSNRGIFQITEVSHMITGMTWTTTVEGQYRQTEQQHND